MNKDSLFYSDYTEKDMFYASIIRSPIVSGTIRSIDCIDLPESCRIITAKDIQGKNCITTFNTTFPLLAYERVSYRGEPVGLLVGEDMFTVQKWAQKINIGCTQAFLTNSKESNEKNETIIAQDCVLNGDSETAFSESAFTSENTYSLRLNTKIPSETLGAVCKIKKNIVTMYTPTHWSSHLRMNVAQVLNISEKNIVIKKTKFSSTLIHNPWENTIVSALVALASQVTGKTVYLKLSVEEQIEYEQAPMPIVIQHKIGFSNEGKINAALILITIQTGAYNPFIQTIVNRLTVTALNCYETQNFSIQVKALKTAQPPSNPDIQWADYHSFFAIENQMDNIAELTGLNPLEVRKINTTKQESDFSVRLDEGLRSEVIDFITQESDYLRKYTGYNSIHLQEYSVKSRLPMRGIGFAVGYEGNSFYSIDENLSRQSLEVSIHIDGSAHIHAHAPSTTVENIWKAIAAEQLNMNLESVFIDSDFKYNEELDLPETIFDNINVMTQLLKRCCNAIQKQRFRQPLPITIRRSINTTSKKIWNQEKFSGNPFYTTSWGAAVAEVEVDIKTFAYSIRSVWICIDGGQILHEAKAKAVIRQSVRTILQATQKYHYTAMPPIHVHFIKSENDPKQIGELVFNILPAALSNALSQALKMKITDFPVSPQIIYQAVR